MINQVTLLGRLTKDPEASKTSGGTSAVRFTLAVDKRNSKALKEQGRQSTNFINCKAYGTTADIISRYFTKGSEIALTGYLDTWEQTTPNGAKRYGMDVVVNEFSFTSGTKAPQNTPNQVTEQNWDIPSFALQLENNDMDIPDMRVDSEELPF